MADERELRRHRYRGSGRSPKDRRNEIWSWRTARQPQGAWASCSATTVKRPRWSALHSRWYALGRCRMSNIAQAFWRRYTYCSRACCGSSCASRGPTVAKTFPSRTCTRYRAPLALFRQISNIAFSPLPCAVCEFSLRQMRATGEVQKAGRDGPSHIVSTRVWFGPDVGGLPPVQYTGLTRHWGWLVD